MPLPHYIYVTDQGGIFGSEDEPTPDDYAFTEVGMLTIVRLRDGHYFGREGAWRPIPHGKLVTSEVEVDSGPFHSLAEVFGLSHLPNPQAAAPQGKKNSNGGWIIRRSSPADARRRRFTSS